MVFFPPNVLAGGPTSSYQILRVPHARFLSVGPLLSDLLSLPQNLQKIQGTGSCTFIALSYRRARKPRVLAC